MPFSGNVDLMTTTEDLFLFPWDEYYSNETNGTVEVGLHATVELWRVIPLGVLLTALSLLTFIGNAMVLYAVRTERRLQTVSILV